MLLLPHTHTFALTLSSVRFPDGSLFVRCSRRRPRASHHPARHARRVAQAGAFPAARCAVCCGSLANPLKPSMRLLSPFACSLAACAGFRPSPVRWPRTMRRLLSSVWFALQGFARLLIDVVAQHQIKKSEGFHCDLFVSSSVGSGSNAGVPRHPFVACDGLQVSACDQRIAICGVVCGSP